eukprot:GEMP01016530.1.p1 GENE.GEMP01016530.1~~GEMP01016530.1.p1  ORF type:complete len:445 (+),score=77.57 GEMP01016530.1:79-1413(+)
MSNIWGRLDGFHALTLSLTAATVLYHVWAKKEQKKINEVTISIDSLIEALTRSDKVTDITGPIEIPSHEGAVSFMSFKISHFASKAYVTVGISSDSGVHMKLQTIFKDNRPNMSEEERYYIANEWNATKRYTRCKYNSVSSSAHEPGTFALEYDILLPGHMSHSICVDLLDKTLTMWHTSAVACVLHIVNYKKAALPFATHGVIVGNTIEFQVLTEDLMNQNCAICLEAFQKDEWVRRLPCLHVFHTCIECNIDTHLVRDKQCPVCRTPIDVMDSMATVPKKSQVSNMREMLHQLRADYQRQDEPASLDIPCEVLDAVLAEDDDGSSSCDTPMRQWRPDTPRPPPLPITPPGEWSQGIGSSASSGIVGQHRADELPLDLRGDTDNSWLLSMAEGAAALHSVAEAELAAAEAAEAELTNLGRFNVTEAMEAPIDAPSSPPSERIK